MLELYAKRVNPALDASDLEKQVNAFMAKVQDEAFKHDADLQNNVCAVAGA